jgi:hypothetical protein
MVDFIGFTAIIWIKGQWENLLDRWRSAGLHRATVHLDQQQPLPLLTAAAGVSCVVLERI